MGTVQLIPRCELYTRKYGSYIILQRWFILKLRVIDTSCARASQIIHCWTCTHLLRQHTFFLHVCSCLLASFDHSGPKLTSSEISAAEENYMSSMPICRWKWFSKAPVSSTTINAAHQPFNILNNYQVQVDTLQELHSYHSNPYKGNSYTFTLNNGDICAEFNVLLAFYQV